MRTVVGIGLLSMITYCFLYMAVCNTKQNRRYDWGYNKLHSILSNCTIVFGCMIIPQTPFKKWILLFFGLCIFLTMLWSYAYHLRYHKEDDHSYMKRDLLVVGAAFVVVIAVLYALYGVVNGK